ncbi:hypothetical protein C461_07629 [Halorubrum aidingense JCM 13560]|uniref:Uncharacterized protein n=1 Tax=Halorubrum aidingense JCM 13560 TaxID=1230454 RepID=M0PDI9_9EURY|nr:hypothetical protein [Halorubrum aidingense]EMA67579.1 hypothetical protein C461_07629 [Halorubrum aidingense JCM 13560]
MSESRVAKATIRDDARLEALAEAEEEHGSLADAIRFAVSEAYVDGDDASESGDGEIPLKAREGHRKLVEWTGIGGRIELETAESVLANHLNIQTDAIRRMVVKPLKAADVIRLHQGIHDVWIIVGSLDDEPISVDTEPDTPARKAATDGGEARERLDELAAAGTEVADGE